MKNAYDLAANLRLALDMSSYSVVSDQLVLATLLVFAVILTANDVSRVNLIGCAPNYLYLISGFYSAMRACLCTSISGLESAPPSFMLFTTIVFNVIFAFFIL